MRICAACSGTRRYTIPAREFEFYGRKFQTAAVAAPCQECSQVEVAADRTDARTQGVTPVRITLSIEPAIYPDPTDPWTIGVMVGGVTGYERCYLSTRFIAETREKGWWACAGGMVYDGLFISAASMRGALSVMRVTDTEAIAAVRGGS